MLTSTKVIIAIIVACGIIYTAMYLRLNLLQDENIKLTASNESLTAIINQREKELELNKQAIDELNKRLVTLRSQARKGEDAINEALKKSNDNCVNAVVSDDVLNKLH